LAQIRCQYWIPKDCIYSDKVEELLRKIFVKDPRDRLTAVQILQFIYQTYLHYPLQIYLRNPLSQPDIQVLEEKNHLKLKEIMKNDIKELSKEQMRQLMTRP